MRFTTTFLLIAAVVGAFSLAGCGNEARPAQPTAPTGPTNDGPDWKKDPTQGGKILGAYGVSEKMFGGEDAQVKRARLAARQELASMINAKIQSVVKDWIREGGVITSQDNAQAAMTSFEAATRAVVNQDLAGTMQRDSWIDERNGKLYVWMVANPEIAAKIAADAKAAARENKELRSHMAAKIEADKAFADLDKLIDKEMSGGK